MKPKYLTLPAVLAAMVLLRGAPRSTLSARCAGQTRNGLEPRPPRRHLQKHIYFAKEASSGGAEAAAAVVVTEEIAVHD